MITETTFRMNRGSRDRFPERSLDLVEAIVDLVRRQLAYGGVVKPSTHSMLRVYTNVVFYSEEIYYSGPLNQIDCLKKAVEAFPKGGEVAAIAAGLVLDKDEAEAFQEFVIRCCRFASEEERSRTWHHIIIPILQMRMANPNEKINDYIAVLL